MKIVLKEITYLVTLQYHKNVNSAYVINDLATQQIAVRQEYRGANNIDLLIPNNCLETLSNHPYVKWVELIVAPSIPDDTQGRSLHRSNGLDTQTGVGRNYTGEPAVVETYIPTLNAGEQS